MYSMDFDFLIMLILYKMVDIWLQTSFDKDWINIQYG